MTNKINELAKALNEILFVIRDAKDIRKRVEATGDVPGLMRFSDLPDEDDLYTRQPVLQALYAGLRDFGRVLGEHYTREEALKIVDIAISAQTHTEEWKDPTSLIDRCWSGIKFADGIWLA